MTQASEEPVAINEFLTANLIQKVSHLRLGWENVARGPWSK